MGNMPPFNAATAFVISDTHWFHDNIVKYCGRHEQIEKLLGPRKPVKTIDHNWYMVEKWNSVIGPTDAVLHLGDVFAWFKDGQFKFENAILPTLNGSKYLILGNHDKAPRSVFERMGFTIIEPFTTVINGRKISFSHYPLTPAEFREDTIHIHGHIHNNPYEGTNGAMTQPNQINVSVEMIDYTPRRIADLLK